MKEKVAVIYPLLHEHIERILRGKDVFCKYIGMGNPGLKVEDKLLFYESGGQFRVMGEATIRTIEFLTPEEVIAKYDNRLFITKDELDNYRRLRDRPLDRKLMVLCLANISRYKEPCRTAKPVTMVGQMLSKEEYNNMLSTGVLRHGT